MAYLKSLFLVTFIFLLASFDGVKLVKVKITPTVKVSIPASFAPMTDDDLAKKYVPYRKPTAMFTSPDRMVDFGFNQTETRWRQEDLPMLKDFYKSSISSMHTNVDFIKETIQTINKRDFLVFEFVSEVVDNDPNSLKKGSAVRQYSYIQYTVEGNKILVFNFTCPSQLKDKWQETAEAVMSSIKISKS